MKSLTNLFVFFIDFKLYIPCIFGYMMNNTGRFSINSSTIYHDTLRIIIHPPPLPHVHQSWSHFRTHPHNTCTAVCMEVRYMEVRISIAASWRFTATLGEFNDGPRSRECQTPHWNVFTIFWRPPVPFNHRKCRAVACIRWWGCSISHQVPRTNWKPPMSDCCMSL